MAVTLKTVPEGHPHTAGPIVAHNVIYAATDITGFNVIQLFSVPAGCVVLDLIYNVTGAFTASTTVTLGDGGDADRFIDASLDVPSAVGCTSMKQDAQPGSGGGYIYAAADTIDATFGGATATVGTMEVFLVYMISKDFAE